MRFLRMLTNALVAGALAAAYLTVVVLQLNPHVPLLSATTARLYGVLALFYGIHLAVLFYVALVMREFVSLRALSPGWVSVRVLAWLSAASCAGAAMLMWLNVDGLSAALNETAVRRMTAGAAATTATALVLLGLAAAHFSFGRRGSRVGAWLLTLAVVGSLALPVAARGPGVAAAPSPRVRATSALPFGPSPGPRVVMLLLDGASLDYIWPRAAGGRLPNFARLLEGGAAMDLATVRPTAPEPVWATVATGMYPAKSGILGPSRYSVRGGREPLALLPDHCFSHALVHLGLLRREPNTPELVRSRTMWDILADAGVSVGVVRWPLTYPAAPVRGFVLSERVHDLIGSVHELDDRGAFPPEAMTIARGAQEDAEAVGWLPAAAAVGFAPEQSAAARDDFYGRAMRALGQTWPVQFSALRYQGLDTVGHYNLRYTEPRELGDVSEETRRQHLQVIERYYGHVDEAIGEAIASLSPGDLLLVVSGFGMQPPNAVKRVLARLLGDPMSGTHERAPDGFLLAYGTAVSAGRRQRGSLVDVTPTVLYYLGLPVGRDMDGYARADLFRPEFTGARPIAFIPTYNR